MSFAIYGESSGYVHLVTGKTRVDTLNLFLADIEEVGIDIRYIYNVYAVQNRDEDKELEDFVEKMIAEANGYSLGKETQ